MQADSSSSGLSGGAVAAIVIVAVAVGLLHIIGYWKTLSKGGEAGPMALLLIITCLAPIAFLPALKLVNRPAWWVVLLYIPIVNIVVLAIISIDLAKSFGKGTGFGIGLWLLPPIFYMILGFGSSSYRGSSVTSA
ncbi:MAG: signal peptidase I [Acidimicrobiia bacterium]|nr:signal peptidase I [Acidimicrobiia bacterium]